MLSVSFVRALDHLLRNFILLCLVLQRSLQLLLFSLQLPSRFRFLLPRSQSVPSRANLRTSMVEPKCGSQTLQNIPHLPKVFFQLFTLRPQILHRAGPAHATHSHWCEQVGSTHVCLAASVCRKGSQASPSSHVRVVKRHPQLSFRSTGQGSGCRTPTLAELKNGRTRSEFVWGVPVSGLQILKIMLFV